MNKTGSPGGTHSSLLLLFAFVISRLLILLFSVESVSWVEELYRGAIGKSILDGLLTSFWNYQADEYSGGSLIIGCFNAIWFFLTGPNLFSLKLTGLFFSSLSFILTLQLCRKFLKIPALFVAPLFIFCPPSLLRLSLLVMGFHTESIVFTLGALLSFFSYLENPKSSFKIILTGLILGLGTWFAQITLISTVSIFLGWIFLQKPKTKDILLFFLGFISGFSPWLPFNLHQHWAGAHFLKSAFLFSQSSEITQGLEIFRIKKLARLFLIHLPKLPDFSFTLPKIGNALSFISMAVVITTIIRHEIQHTVRNKFLVFLKIYPALFIFIYWISFFEIDIVNLPIEKRYLYPFYYLLILYFYFCLFHASKKIRYIFYSLSLSLGIFGYVSHFPRLETPLGALKYQGYSYSQLGDLWVEKFPITSDSSLSFQELIRKIPSNQQTLFCSSLRNTNPAGEFASPQEILKAIGKFPSHCQHFAMIAWGSSAGGITTPEALRGAASLSIIPDEMQPYFCQGLTQSIAFDLRDLPLDALSTFQKEIPKCYQEFLFRYGVLLLDAEIKNHPYNIKELLAIHSPDALKRIYQGMGAGFAFAWNTSGQIPNFDLGTLDFSPDFAWGLGWGLRENMLDDPIRTKDWILKLPQSLQSSALSGAQACEQWYHLDLSR